MSSNAGNASGGALAGAFMVGVLVGLMMTAMIFGSSEQRAARECEASCKPAQFSKLDTQRGCICGAEVKK